MSDKYKIINCPAFVLMRTATSGTYFDMCGNAKGHIKCADCTDCVMKQIVELCKGIKCPCEFKGADCWECTESGAKRLADRILQLLNVQEVE